MVSEKTGTVIGMTGSILVIGLAVLSLIVYLNNDIRSGIELVFIKFLVSLGIGGVGIIGGLLSLRGRRSGNFLPLIGAVIAILGLFVPLGQIGVYTALPSPTIIYTPVTLFSTPIYIDVILMCLGGLLGLIVKSDRAVKNARDDDVFAKAEIILSNYLKENKGKAFTAQVLHERCIEDTQLDMTLDETEKILNDFYLLGRFHKDIKENTQYYYVP